MYAMVTRFEDNPTNLNDGISHVLDEVIPEVEKAEGVRGIWLANRDIGERLSVMLFDDPGTADKLFAAIAERRAADPGRNRPTPVDSVVYEVYASVLE